MLSFREREWLALLPADLGVAAQIGPTPAPADPAAGLRDAEPLSPDTVSRAFSGLPVLRGFSKLSFALGPWAARSYAFRACSVSVAAALLLIPVWLFNDSAGTFGARQMAFGTAALGLSHAALILIHSTADGFRRLLSGSTLLPSSVGGSAFDSHPFASLVRYLQLIEISSAASGADQKEDVAAEHGIGSSATRSILVTHDRADPLCPCSLPECAGRLVLSTGWLYMGAVVLNIAFGIAACIFTGWTALVTFAPLFWSSGWAALGVFLLLATLVHTPVTFLVLPQSSVSLLRLSLRLQHRSLYLALRDFLARYHDALFSGFPVDWEQLPREDLFEVLVTRLSRVWERGHFWIQSGQASLALFGLQEVVPIVLNIAGGSCITLYSISLLLLISNALLFNLFHLAVANEQIKRVAALLRSASYEAKGMLVRAKREAAIGAARADTAGAADVLAAHDRVLEDLTRAAENSKATMLGFAVDAGFARGVLVTLVTVAFSLWTLLRGAGVVGTADVICPTR